MLKRILYPSILVELAFLDGLVYSDDLYILELV